MWSHPMSLASAWAAEVFPSRPEGYFIGPYIAHYVDDLMMDMGLERLRANNPLTEYFGRFLPRRYRDVHDERRRARGQ